VYLVKKNTSGHIYAMKVVEKKLVLKEQLHVHTLLEKNILRKARFPFIV